MIFQNLLVWEKIYPEGTFVTNGLSKSHAAGGYRLGYVIFPQHAVDLKRQFKKNSCNRVYCSIYTNSIFCCCRI